MENEIFSFLDIFTLFSISQIFIYFCITSSNASIHFLNWHFFLLLSRARCTKIARGFKTVKKNVLATHKYWKRWKKLLARIGKHHSIIHCSYFPCSGSVYVLNLICFKLKTWTKTCEKNIVSSIDRLNENVTIWLEHESNGLTWPEIVIVKIFIKLKPYNYNNNI